MQELLTTGHTVEDAPGQRAEMWMLPLVEPLLDESTRHAILASWHSAATKGPEPAAKFAAGVCCHLGITLPADDPWRKASARLSSLTLGANPPPEDGAVVDGRRLGTLEDFPDLIPQHSWEPPPLADPWLWPILRPIDERAAAAVAFAAAGKYEDLSEGLLVSQDWQEWVWDAWRWLCFRRRYWGERADSPWPILAAQWWHTYVIGRQSVPWWRDSTIESIGKQYLRPRRV